MKNKIQLREFLAKDKKFQEALVLVRKNTTGKIFLTGGYLYNYLLFGNTKRAEDIDFLITENLNKKIILPKEWKIKINTFNHPCFIKKDMKIDPVQLRKHSFIIKEKMKPTVKSYLKSTPLNLGAIVWDTEKNKLYGGKGLKAIKEKQIKIHNKKAAEHLCKIFKNKKSPESLVKDKAKQLELGFKLPKR